MPSVDPPELNPAQQEAVDQLGSAKGDRPEFPGDLGPRLRSALQDGLAPILDELVDGDELWLNKHKLSQIHGCEAKLLAEESDTDFVVTVPIARGAVAHKAIELGIHWKGEANPLDLVDEATARLGRSDHWLTDWLQTAPMADVAELRSAAGDRVSKFFECFPPLSPRWRPVTESSLRVDLLDDRVHLSGKVDLTLGAAKGNRAGKVVVDLKTGSPAPAHRDDLRFYALLEAVRIGVPPRLVVSYYLDSATIHREAVTEPLLLATVARVVDGGERLVDLRNGSVAPVKRPSYACRWCPVLDGCDEGRRHLRDTDDLDDLDDPTILPS